MATPLEKGGGFPAVFMSPKRPSDVWAFSSDGIRGRDSPGSHFTDGYVGCDRLQLKFWLRELMYHVYDCCL